MPLERIVVHSHAAEQILKGREGGITNELQRRAQRIMDGAGPGHEMTTEVGPSRVRVEVRTATFEAMRAEAKHRTLTRAIDRGRG